MIAGSLGWAILMAASAAWSITRSAWVMGPDPIRVIALFAAGGFVSFVPAAFLCRLARPKRTEARLAAWLFSLTVITVVATGLFHAANFRLTAFAAHSAPFSPGWFIETGFIMAGAFYQFLVLGMRMFFPLGFLALLAIATFQAQRRR